MTYATLTEFKTKRLDIADANTDEDTELNAYRETGYDRINAMILAAGLGSVPITSDTNLLRDGEMYYAGSMYYAQRPIAGGLEDPRVERYERLGTVCVNAWIKGYKTGGLMPEGSGAFRMARITSAGLHGQGAYVEESDTPGL